MNSSHYRREYHAYCSALESKRYDYHSGLPSESSFKHIFDRDGDLFTPESIATLLESWRQTPPHFETKRRADLGELDFEWLAETLIMAVSNG
ncbi:MAG TPA: hypothetical protein VM943_03955 [Pyrinomonadaceae bacterium]|nr:hypothetical protein [Pyrinomonadaceae bacterium]